MFKPFCFKLSLIMSLFVLTARAGHADPVSQADDASVWNTRSSGWVVVLATDYQPDGSLSRSFRKGAWDICDMVKGWGVTKDHLFYLADNSQATKEHFIQENSAQEWDNNKDDYKTTGEAVKGVAPDDSKLAALVTSPEKAQENAYLPLRGQPSAANFKNALKVINHLALPKQFVAIFVLTRTPEKETKPFIVYTQPESGETGGQVGLKREDFRLNCNARARILFIDASNTGNQDVHGLPAEPDYPNGYFNLTGELDPEQNKRALVFSASGSRIGSLLLANKAFNIEDGAKPEDGVFLWAFKKRWENRDGLKSPSDEITPCQSFFGDSNVANDQDTTNSQSVVSFVRTKVVDTRNRTYRQYPVLYAAQGMEQTDLSDVISGSPVSGPAKVAPHPDDLTPVSGEARPVILSKDDLSADTRRNPASRGERAYAVVSVKHDGKLIILNMIPELSSRLTAEWRGNEIKRRIGILIDLANQKDASGHPRGLFLTDFDVHSPDMDNADWFVKSKLLDDASKGVVITADPVFAQIRHKTPKALAHYLLQALFNMLTTRQQEQTVSLFGNSVERSFTQGLMRMKPNATEQDLIEARDDFKAAIQQDVSYIAAYFALCRVQLDLHETAGARKTLNQIQDQFLLTGEDAANAEELQTRVAAQEREARP